MRFLFMQADSLSFRSIDDTKTIYIDSVRIKYLIQILNDIVNICRIKSSITIRLSYNVKKNIYTETFGSSSCIW